MCGSSLWQAPDDWNGFLVGPLDNRRTRRGGDMPGKRREASPKLGISNRAQSLAKLLGDGSGLLARLHTGLGGGQPALSERDLVDRLITEEAVDPLDDHGAKVLDERGMRAFNQQSEGAA